MWTSHTTVRRCCFFFLCFFIISSFAERNLRVLRFTHDSKDIAPCSLFSLLLFFFVDLFFLPRCRPFVYRVSSSIWYIYMRAVVKNVVCRWRYMRMMFFVFSSILTYWYRKLEIRSAQNVKKCMLRFRKQSIPFTSASEWERRNKIYMKKCLSPRLVCFAHSNEFAAFIISQLIGVFLQRNRFYLFIHFIFFCTVNVEMQWFSL